MKMYKKYQKYMHIAIKEAELSFKEGNKGFGAVIIKNEKIISKAHDSDRTNSNPLAHAEMNAINLAIKKIGADLSGCILFSTHEPCPMCSGAIIWSKISKLFYGFPIKNSLLSGKTMINLESEEILRNAPWKIQIIKDFLKDECSYLYNEDVKAMTKKLLRYLKNGKWDILEKEYTDKRSKWFNDNRVKLMKKLSGNDIEKAYQLLLMKLKISHEEAPIVHRNDKNIVFRSRNFCPTIFACKILNLDTKKICKKIFEKSTEELLKNINPKIKFSRNYDKIRPYECYCEEIIYIE